MTKKKRAKNSSKFNPVIRRLPEKSSTFFWIFERRRPLLEEPFFNKGVFGTPGRFVGDAQAVRNLHKLDHFRHADIPDFLHERLVYPCLPIGELA